MSRCICHGRTEGFRCENCVDTVGDGPQCTHDCVIELTEQLAVRDLLIKDLKSALNELTMYHCRGEFQKKKGAVVRLDGCPTCTIRNVCKTRRFRELLFKIAASEQGLKNGGGQNGTC